MVGRDLARAVEDGQKAVAKAVNSAPRATAWSGAANIASSWPPKVRLGVIGPITILLILLILFALYGNFKFPLIILLSVVLTEPVGALIALKLTGTPFSVSSVLGLLVLMGVSVETAVIDVSYINKLRLEGHRLSATPRMRLVVRLRPIMMTALVACLGLLPAALSHGIGSDTQRPFAIVIVAGLFRGSSWAGSSARSSTKWSPRKETSSRCEWRRQSCRRRLTFYSFKCGLFTRKSEPASLALHP